MPFAATGGNSGEGATTIHERYTCGACTLRFYWLFIRNFPSDSTAMKASHNANHVQSAHVYSFTSNTVPQPALPQPEPRVTVLP